MTRLAIISPEEMQRILKHLGFERKRQVGSHVFFEHPDGRCTVVPFHPGEDLGRG
ncbi:type II toxin-antitoxin system HicA family toxin [Neomoorella thermoacetica]|uniref:type II toxin-antitoxin system HicA family toxin n=1 Tax=Neomoorella thermoacetica TaxID=1525 RepID=UPI0018C89EC3|nr:type II toxin-antitoxin system HicA family toxin [Moorella thermoacetica]